MSIPRIKPNVVSRFDGFEKQAFTVAVTDKTFRLLLDTLYTNKERAVIRELWTNAYDSHVQAGKADVPFLCQLPTVLEPVFRVRDYGVSMTHDEVMHLYSTVFESTKEATNDYVGQFGLGSKSPFSYTDSFTVTAYLNGEQRTYVAALDENGIPTITFVAKCETDEPTGFEVSFPVQHRHVTTFMDEAQNVSRGFDVPPIIADGATFNKPEPILAHNNWAIYENHKGMATSIRQGCVLYPVHSSQVRINDITGWNHNVVVTVPIGTCDVAANREALSLDDETAAVVRKVFEDAANDIKNYIETRIRSAPTFLEATKRYVEYESVVNVQNVGRICWGGSLGKWMVGRDIMFDYPTKSYSSGDPKEPEFRNKKDEIIRPTFFVNTIPKMRFIIDRDQPMVRRRKRIVQYVNTEPYHTFIVKNPTNCQLERLVRRLGLTKNQVISVTSLPDVPPPPRNPSTTRTGVYTSTPGGSIIRPADIPEKFYWVPVENGKPSTKVKILTADFKLEDIPFAVKKLLKVFKMEERPLFFLTPMAQKRLKVTDDTNLLKLVNSRHHDMITMATVYGKINAISYSTPRDVLRIFATQGVIDNDEYETYNIINQLFNSVYRLDLGYRNHTVDGSKVGEAIAEKLATKYPLLFPNSSESDIIEYIESRKNK